MKKIHGHGDKISHLEVQATQYGSASEWVKNKKESRQSLES